MLLLSHENDLISLGYNGVVGVDEAGRGPLAGPVVAASFLFLPELKNLALLKDVNDSKRLSEKKRGYIYDTLINEFGETTAYASVDHSEIDNINIFQATLLAMKKSVEKLEKPQNSIVLVDGNKSIKNLDLPQKTYIKGDSRVFTIAAASIIAKVARDRMMSEFDEQYPQYGFKKNKGYGTAEHLAALKRFGPTPIHRKTFAPIKNFI